MTVRTVAAVVVLEQHELAPFKGVRAAWSMRNRAATLEASGALTRQR